jgi:hypothetical protein
MAQDEGVQRAFGYYIDIQTRRTRTHDEQNLRAGETHCKVLVTIANVNSFDR